MIKKIVLLTLLAIAGVAPWAHAYERGTHREISDRAGDPSVSSLDRVLKEDLGFTDGVRGTLIGTPIRGLVGNGAHDEDVPARRSLNHFHNPLLPWEDAGLSVGLLASGQSSVLWQQNPSQDTSTVTILTFPRRSGGGNWSWQDTRRRYLDALTGARRPDRDNALPGPREQTFAEVFLSLGHLIHLIQDATVPVHVRNDRHPDFLPFQEDGYEKWVERARTKSDLRFEFDRLLTLDPVRPPTSIFTETRNASAPVPIARLIDTDGFLGLNFDVLTATDLGVAEYTNGNFLSRDTIFRNFTLPRPSSLEPTAFSAPEGARFRTYFSKVGEGEAVPHFVAVGALHRSLREALQVDVSAVPAGGWVLEDRVHADYAARLIPRAVGFSAALLDYFFRGKLDVDLFSDDGVTLQLRGTNASPDPLVDGTLKLYADVPTLDPEGRPTTVRRELTALSDTTVRGVDPGQALSSALFQPQEAERFVAVYQGRLGNEIPVPNPDTPALSFPGAVIGKVLGGVRVEEVFSDDTRQWMLRSPIGVFALHDETGPLTTARFRDLRWGDGPDHLLARTFGGLQQVPRFAAYQVPRQPNSVEPVTQVLAGVTIVRLASLVPETAFPAIAPVLTTVTLTEVIDYRQQLAMADRIMVRQWRPIFPDLPENDGTNYPLTGFAPGAVTVQTVNEQQFRFTDTVRVVLDLDHSAYTATASDPDRLSYAWHVADVGLTADGHIIAVVKVTLHPPFLSFQPRLTQPVYGLDAQGTQVVAETCTFFSGCQPREITLFRSYPGELTPLLWAVVDVTTGQVLATTAEPALTIATHQIVAPPTLVYFHLFERRMGGPRPTTQDLPRNWTETGTRSWDGQPAATTTDLTLLAGEPRAVGGWYRRELRDALTNAGLLGPAGAPQNRSVTLAFGDLGPNQQLLVFHFPPTPPAELRPGLGFAVRARRAPGGERLVFLVDGFLSGQGTIQAVAAWDAVAQQARVAFTQRGSGETGIEIVDAAGNLALVGQFAFERGYVITLDGTAPARVFEDRLFGFRLLDPQYLYNVDVQRFFRLDPPLQATPLPARLTTLDPNPVFGDYHAIRLP